MGVVVTVLSEEAFIPSLQRAGYSSVLFNWLRLSDSIPSRNMEPRAINCAPPSPPATLQPPSSPPPPPQQNPFLPVLRAAGHVAQLFRKQTLQTKH